MERPKQLVIIDYFDKELTIARDLTITPNGYAVYYGSNSPEPMCHICGKFYCTSCEEHQREIIPFDKVPKNALIARQTTNSYVCHFFPAN